MNVRGIAAANGAGLLNVFSSLLTNVWLTSVVTREVDKPTLGLFLFVMTTASYLGLLQLSLDFAAGQRIAAALAVGDETGAARLFRQTAVINRAVAVAIVALAAIAIGVVWFQEADPERRRLFATLFALFGTSQAVACLARPIVAGLTGAQKIATIQLVRVAGSVLSTVAAYGMIKAGVGVVSLAVSDLGLQVGVWVVLRSRFFLSCPWASRPVADLRPGFGELIRYGAAVSLTSLVNYACLNCDLFLLLLSDRATEATAEYYVWARFPQLFYSLIYMFFAAVSPALAAAYANDPKAGRAAFARVILVFVGITLAGMIGLGLWLAPVVRVWAGIHYVLPDGAAVAVAMTAGVGARSLLVGLSLPFYATGTVRAVTVAHAVQLAVKIGLGLVLVRPFTLAGVAIADVAGALAACAVLSTVLIRSADWTFRYASGSAVCFVAVVAALAFAAPFTESLGIRWTAVGIVVTALTLAVPALVALRRFGIFSRRRAAVDGPVSIRANFPEVSP